MTTATDAGSESVIAKLTREAIGRVVSNVSREQIEKALDCFDRSYYDYGYDLEARLALFSRDVMLEDPVGAIIATNIAELEAFFRGVENNGVRMDRRPVERILVANEALVRYESRIRAGDLDPETLHVTVHFAFNPAGQICKVRVFFDEASIGKPVSF